jgi:hypothetical protein
MFVLLIFWALHLFEIYGYAGIVSFQKENILWNMERGED